MRSKEQAPQKGRKRRPEGAREREPETAREREPENGRERKPEAARERKAGKPRKKSAVKAFGSLILKLMVITVVIWGSLTYVFGIFRLSGNSMYPMLKDGDLCITYRLDEYHSGDVVAYRVQGETRFGRILARNGDTVDGDEEGVRINGMHPSEEVFYPTQMLDTNLNLPRTLGEGEFLVLNDYREDLNDSRTYGVVREGALEGKVIFIFRRRGF